MKLSILSLLLLAIAASSFACSSDSDTVTLEEYFAELETISSEAEAEADETFANFPDVPEDPLLWDETVIAQWKEFAAALPGMFNDPLGRIKAIDPPSEVETQHDNFVAAMEDLIVALEGDSRAVNEAETGEELLALEAPNRTLFGPPGARVDDACFELVLVADANGITVSNAICADDD